MTAIVSRPGLGLLVNSALNLGGFAVATLLGAVAGIVTARALGAAAVGVLAISLGLGELGRVFTLFAHAPSILEVHRGGRPNLVFGTSLIVKTAGALVFFALVCSVAPSAGTRFGVPWRVWALGALVPLAGVLLENAMARHEAANQMLRRNLALALSATLVLAAVLMLLKQGRYNIETAILTSLLGLLGAGLAFGLPSPSRPTGFDRGVARYLLSYGARHACSIFLLPALLWVGTLIVVFALGYAEAGVYYVVTQFTLVFVMATMALGSALLPALSERAGRGEETTSAYQRATVISLAVALLGIVTMALLARPALALYGQDFETGWPLLLTLLMFGLAAALFSPAASLLTVHGRAGRLAALALALVLLDAGLSWLAVGPWGAMGVASATSLTLVVGLMAAWQAAFAATGATPFGPASAALVRELLPAALRWRIGPRQPPAN